MVYKDLLSSIAIILSFLENRQYAAAPAAATKLPKGQVVSVIGAVVDVQFEDVSNIVERIFFSIFLFFLLNIY